MEARKVKIPSSTGNLSAEINYPEEETGRLSILCPGYLDSKNYKGLKGLAETLSSKGYTVVRFKPTGTWESDGDISQYTTTQYLVDVKNVLEYMLRQKDYKHVLLGGHSRGGQVALLYAARDSRITVVVAIMPSSNKRAKNDERLMEWKKNGFSVSVRDLPDGKSGEKRFRVPISYLEDMDNYDVVKDVKRIKAQTVFIAGELDDSCPVEMVREIFNSANDPKKFVIIPGIGHDYRDLTN